MIITTRAQRRQLARDNEKLPARLAVVPRELWPDQHAPIHAVWRSRDFLVQVYVEAPPVLFRLSILRTTLNDAGRWVDGISWEELQRLKAECGFGDYDAVEVYPPDRDVVNVANLRHLWVLGQSLPFAWRKKP